MKNIRGISMKITDIFDLNKTQFELDFIDIDIDIATNIPLFISPTLLKK